jgi:hypothetical protein
MRCLRCLQLTVSSVFIAFSASGQNSLAPTAARVLRANLQLSSLLAGRLELRGHGENLVSDADSQMSGRPVELYRRVVGAIENHWNVHASFVDLEETMRDLYYVLINEDETPEVSSWIHPAQSPKAHDTVYWINKSGKVAARGSPMKRDGQGVDPAIADDKYSAAEQKVLEGVREQSALLRKLGAEFRSLQGENSSLAAALVDLRRYTRLKCERVLDFNRMSSVAVRACLQQGDPAIFEETYRSKKAEKHKGSTHCPSFPPPRRFLAVTKLPYTRPHWSATPITDFRLRYRSGRAAHRCNAWSIACPSRRRHGSRWSERLQKAKLIAPSLEGNHARC